MIGLYLDEFAAGQRIELGQHVFAAEAIKRFARQFTPVGFHMDADEAAQGLFAKPSAAGWHICCGWMVCFVESNSKERARHAASGKVLPEIGPSPGLSALRWPNPVYPDDAISYGLTVTAKRDLKSRPNWGLVTFLADGFHAARGQVLSFEGKVLVARR